VIEVRKGEKSSHYRGLKRNEERLKMKKIIASAVGIIMVGGVAVTTASAVENEFGGYWRTRAVSQTDFNGLDSKFTSFDNRTRLYYTAKFNDDFKFINKFEHNTAWGDDNGGDIGADGTGIFKIKQSYADFTVGALRTKVGIQGNAISRGFVFADDFSGIVLEPTFGNVLVSAMWARVNGEYVNAANPYDEDILHIEARVNVGDGKLTPFLTYHGGNGDVVGELEAFYLGLDGDIKFGETKTWGSLIYQGGTNAGGDDNKGWLAAVGANWTLLHGQFFYATGDDSPLDGDNEEFAGVPGRSYYWAEIMGYGKFDENGLPGTPNDGISNIFAVNIGVKAKASDAWTLSADLWYAQLAESNALGNDELGTEIDLVATYKIMDNLNLDLVAAYLFAGDAVAPLGEINQEDPVEIGARLSLSF
jgi:hypothetical protein